MLRIVLGMIIGAAAGAGLTYYFIGADDPPVGVAPMRPATTASPIVVPSLVGRGGGAETDGAARETPTSAPVGAGVAAAPPGLQPGTAPTVVAPLQNQSTLEEVLAITNPSERRASLIQLAVASAAQDPVGALAAARRIPNRQDQQAFQSVVVRELARTDARFLLENLNQLEGRDAQMAVIQALATEPTAQFPAERLLAIADSLDAQISQFARQIALRRWAETDPTAALAYAQALPPGQSREQQLSSVLGGMAQRDPEAALAWLAAERNPSRQLLGAVYAGIATNDPARAIDLLFEDGLLQNQAPSSQQMQTVLPLLMSLGHSGGAERPRLADRLLAARGDGGDRYLQMFLSNWSQSAPDDAVAWLARNGTALSATTYEQIASNIAGGNPELAAAFTNQVPAAARDRWIVGVAQAYAQRDAEAANNWLAQYAGQPVYGEASMVVAAAIANFDAPRAAELFAGTSMRDQRAGGVAGQIAYQWMQSDPVAARTWVTSLPRGNVRDGALTMLVTAPGSNTLPDAATLELFSDERAREGALSGLIMRIAQTDETRARELLDAHISDPALRARAEQAIENRNAFPGGMNMIVTSDGRTLFR